MFNSKTFRLFISSTFSDFKSEREILQSNVFPHIKAYAAQQGFSFQPIDLRWGVSNEAQLDQKTLELCLNEVKACKAYKHPNFLVMLGDRYGWVPLPYAIEENEFEALFSLMSEQDKRQIQTWYQKDLNQLPVSYLLKERKEAYEEFSVWEIEEVKLRKALQTAANDSTIDADNKRKYFTSATESEVEEGIVSYLKPTQYQNELFAEKQHLKEIDAQHVFGFLRSVEKSTQLSETFIGKDYEKAQAFKSRVNEVLLEKNTLHSNVAQINKDELDERYLNDFQEKVIEFLESQIDAQKQQEEQESLTPLQIELEGQALFARKKRENFVGQDKALVKIEDYISDENQQPLVVYGRSGSGKSALMAKAVEQSELCSQKRVLYRFVGATGQSSTSKGILFSLLDELSIEISKELQNSEANNLSIDNENCEIVKELSQRMHFELLRLESEIVVFLDAADQLQSVDQFLWLPEKLPTNIKVVISVLSDHDYPEDCISFDILQTLTSNFVELSDFKEPSLLVYQLLQKENRTLQRDQERYFLDKFIASPTPFFISMTVQEMKSWHSDDYVCVKADGTMGREVHLAHNQQGIVEEFIRNLTDLYHHNQVFVYKVLSYLSASKNGLSETELFQLLSVDSDFVEHIAPDTWHDNSTKELPFVHWSRLQSRFEPFLNIRDEENTHLLYLSNREFCHAIKNSPRYVTEHEKIIKATQLLIIKSQQEKALFRNEWDNLYATLIIEYQFRNKDENKLKEYSDFIVNTSVITIFWKEKYLLNLLQNGSDELESGNAKKAICAYKINLLCIEPLLTGDERNERFLQCYIAALQGICKCLLKLSDYQQELFYRKKLVSKLRTVHEQRLSDEMTSCFLYELGQLANYYVGHNDGELALECLIEQESIIKPLFLVNRPRWGLDYAESIVWMADFYYKNDALYSFGKNLIASEEMIEPLYNESKDRYAAIYTRVLNYIGTLYSQQEEHEKSLPVYEQVLEIRRSRYEKGSDQKEEDYARALNNLASNYLKLKCMDKAICYFEQSLKVRENLYARKKEGREYFYFLGLKQLAQAYLENKNSTKAIEYYSIASSISEPLYLPELEMIWGKRHSEVLFYLAVAYMENGEENKALSTFKNNYAVNKNVYGEIHEDTLNILNFIGMIEERFNSDSVNIDEPENTSIKEGTMEDAFNIAKLYAHHNKSEINLTFFLHALSFFDLNFDANRAFETVFNLDVLSKKDGAQELLFMATEISNVKPSHEILQLMVHLRDFIDIEEPIGTLR